MKTHSITVTCKDDRDIARQLIDEAMKIYRDGMHVPPPTKTIGTDETFTSLNRAQVIQATIGLVLHLNLAAGSTGDFDLYKTLDGYLLDPDKRRRINEVVKG